MFNLKKITFNLDQRIITLTPTKCYICSDNDLPPIRLIPVIMYDIEYNSAEKNHKSTIPYYISDGHTNNLRANMLFPMMSFNITESFKITPTTRDITRENSGLQFKYNAIFNLNTSELNNEIDTLFGSSEDLHFLKSYSKNQREGSTSVIMRIQNFLDFVIALSSSSIEMYDDNLNITNFRPITQTQTLDKYNMYRNDGFIGYPHNINRQHYKKLQDLSDRYNSCILVVLKKYINIIKEDPLINVENIRIHCENITMAQFNQKLNICKTEEYPLNVEIYQYISSKLSIYFKNIHGNRYHLMENPIYSKQPLEQVKYNWSAYCSNKEFEDRKASDQKKRDDEHIRKERDNETSDQKKRDNEDDEHRRKERAKRASLALRKGDASDKTDFNFMFDGTNLKKGKTIHEKYLKYKIKYLNLKKLK